MAPADPQDPDLEAAASPRVPRSRPRPVRAVVPARPVPVGPVVARGVPHRANPLANPVTRRGQEGPVAPAGLVVNGSPGRLVGSPRMDPVPASPAVGRGVPRRPNLLANPVQAKPVTRRGREGPAVPAGPAASDSPGRLVGGPLADPVPGLTSAQDPTLVPVVANRLGIHQIRVEKGRGLSLM